MVISKIQRLKVILLLAGYLYVVLTHLQYVEPAHVIAGNDAYVSANVTPKGYDKFGHIIPLVKKIYKTVISRNLSNENTKVAQHLYATRLLFNNASASAADLQLSRYFTPVSALPVKRCFYLRI